jgi:hypothetical protein
MDDTKKPDDKKDDKKEEQLHNDPKVPAGALVDSTAVFNPTVQDMHRSPGVAAARAESEQQGENRRPTVSVMCGVRSGIIMQLHTLPENADLPADYQLGHQEALHYGANPGIDKRFFDYWKSQNSGLGVVVEGLVTAQDEKQPERAGDDGERDKSADKSSSSAQSH